MPALQAGLESSYINPDSQHSRMRLHFSNLKIPTPAIGIATLLTMCSVLAAGLLPFEMPRNDVAWVSQENAVHFGRHGIILSRGILSAITGYGTAITMEVWLRPSRIWTTGCVLTFYGYSSTRQFRVEQDYADLVLQVGEPDKNTADLHRTLRVTNVFRNKQFVLTVTSNDRETMVYVNGELAARSAAFRISSIDMTGRLILANCPHRNHSWSGDMKGLAIFEIAITPPQILNDYQSWVKRGEPSSQLADKLVALYLFHEHVGNIIHDTAPAGVALEIPRQFVVIDQLRFESPITEFRTQRTYVENVLLNIAGFVPLGLMLALYFGAVWKIKRATLTAVIVGATISFAIELLQSFTPTRYSGCTDLVTNTLGTWIGTFLYGSLRSFGFLKVEAPIVSQSALCQANPEKVEL